MNVGCENKDAYIDGELEPSLAHRFEVHLESCNACRIEVALSVDLDRRLREAWSAVAAPDSQRNRVSLSSVPVSRLANASSSRRRLVAAVLILVASLLVIVAVANWKDRPVVESQDVVADRSARVADDDRETSDDIEVTSVQPVAIVMSLEPSDGGRIETIFVRPPQISTEFTIVRAYSTMSSDDPFEVDMNSENRGNDDEE